MNFTYLILLIAIFSTLGNANISLSATNNKSQSYELKFIKPTDDPVNHAVRQEIKITSPFPWATDNQCLGAV